MIEDLRNDWHLAREGHMSLSNGLPRISGPLTLFLERLHGVHSGRQSTQCLPQHCTQQHYAWTSIAIEILPKDKRNGFGEVLTLRQK